MHELMLVVEDHPAMQQFLLRYLPRLGYRITLVGTGAEALEALERDPYDLALLDFNLPDMSGAEIARQIRRREAITRSSRLRLVGYTTLEDRPACLAADMDAHVVKGDLPKLQAALSQTSKSFL